MKFGWLQKQHDTPRSVLLDLIETINATGGIEFDDNELPRPVGDPDWVDLGFVYLDACRVLKVDPLEVEPYDKQDVVA